MRSDKINIVLISLLTLLLLGTWVMWLWGEARQAENSNLIMLTIPMIIVILLMVFFVKRNWSSIKQDLPTEDERTRQVSNRAGALTFYILIYVLLGLGTFEDQLGFTRVSQATGLTILIGAIIYLSLLTYLLRKAR